ncbi:MAG: hypothetical protein KDA60_18785 [Planctomycetales bacterium]|nr:hypothetical protein [Planctomycetales bacterium]
MADKLSLSEIADDFESLGEECNSLFRRALDERLSDRDIARMGDIQTQAGMLMLAAYEDGALVSLKKTVDWYNSLDSPESAPDDDHVTFVRSPYNLFCEFVGNTQLDVKLTNKGLICGQTRGGYLANKYPTRFPPKTGAASLGAHQLSECAKACRILAEMVRNDVGDERTADQRAHGAALFPKGVEGRDTDVIDLILRLDSERSQDRTDMQIATDFFEGDVKKAKLYLTRIRKWRGDGITTLPTRIDQLTSRN